MEGGCPQELKLDHHYIDLGQSWEKSARFQERAARLRLEGEWDAVDGEKGNRWDADGVLAVELHLLDRFEEQICQQMCWEPPHFAPTTLPLHLYLLIYPGLTYSVVRAGSSNTASFATLMETSLYGGRGSTPYQWKCSPRPDHESARTGCTVG